jgi:hypothetical protein
MKCEEWVDKGFFFSSEVQILYQDAEETVKILTV